MARNDNNLMVISSFQFSFPQLFYLIPAPHLTPPLFPQTDGGARPYRQRVLSQGALLLRGLQAPHHRLLAAVLPAVQRD